MIRRMMDPGAPPNHTFDRSAGSRSFAAADQRERSAQMLMAGVECLRQG